MVHFFYDYDIHVNSTYASRQIAIRVLDHLRRRFGEVTFNDFRNAGYDADQIGDHDLVIGHPGPAMSQVRAAGRGRRALLLVPIPPWDELSVHAEQWEHLLLIGGRQWFEDLCEAHRDRLPRFDNISWHHMCVDLALFPRIKRRFNPPGQRQFLYVGQFEQARKNICGLIDVFAGQADRLLICSWLLVPQRATPAEAAAYEAVTSGAHPNIRILPFMLNTSPEFRDLVREVDVYIHLARSDAQATSILETAAYGMVPVATRESGFEFSFGGFLDGEDLESCRRRMAELQAVPGETLEGASWAARQRLRTHHGWAGFRRVLDRAIDRLLTEYPIGS